MSNGEMPLLLKDVSLARAAARDRRAAKHMLAQVYPKIYQVIWSVVPHQSYVEDISQTVTVEVLRSIDNFRGQGPLEAWAGKIAFRCAMRAMKKHRDRDKLQAVLDETHAADLPSPEKNTARGEVFSSLQGYLKVIPSVRRTPLLLHFVHGYTVREVSELVGAPVNTVKDRLKAAVRELRAILDENPELKQAMLEVMS